MHRGIILLNGRSSAMLMLHSTGDRVHVLDWFKNPNKKIK